MENRDTASPGAFTEHPHWSFLETEARCCTQTDETDRMNIWNVTCYEQFDLNSRKQLTLSFLSAASELITSSSLIHIRIRGCSVPDCDVVSVQDLDLMHDTQTYKTSTCLKFQPSRGRTPWLPQGGNIFVNWLTSTQDSRQSDRAAGHNLNK